MREINELTDAEADWVATLVAILDDLEVSLDAASLDAFLERSRSTGRAGIADPTPVINMVGAGIGHLLAEDLGMRWVSVTDADGSRLALHATANSTLVFPLDAVARRWAGEPGNLTRYVAETTAMVQRLRAGLAG